MNRFGLAVELFSVKIVSHTSDLKVCSVVAILPNAWRYEVSGRAGCLYQNAMTGRENKFCLHLLSQYHLHLSLSHSLADCLGPTVDSTTNLLHSSLFSAFHSMMFHSRPVHSVMLSSHRFLCRPLRLFLSIEVCEVGLADLSL